MIHIVGFGSQGSAWAQCLRQSGQEVHIYLHRSGEGFRRAQELGFSVSLLPELATSLARGPKPGVVAMLLPDLQVGKVYRDFLAGVPDPLAIVLAHGYAVYAGDLRDLSPGHDPILLAPKAIGPKLLSHFQDARRESSTGTHTLVAASSAPFHRREVAAALARDLGFAPKNIVETSFEKETIGDLMSEQGLLCGTMFPFLTWTMAAMRDAGVPEALIREECLSEMELIAGLVRGDGPQATWDRISEVAKVGTVAMRDRLERLGARDALSRQFAEILDGRFVEYVRAREWEAGAATIREELAGAEKNRVRPIASSPRPHLVSEL
ncbi:MAG: hypothetical protein AB7P04_11680 [Bacteriovoracia bacterium]